ncbi:MAG: hypothetical protein J6A28_02955 [Clostridia bacterium]|nr:hypothetical protein [Clostridia bacterium]
MNFIKRIWEKIREPKGVWLILFYIFSLLLIAGTVVLVVLQPQQSFWHYILYVLAAATLCYFVYTIVVLAPKIKAGVIKTLRKIKFTNEMLDNYGYRTTIFGIFSFIFNISFVLFQGVLALLTGSAWYITITAYYLVLSLIKGFVLLSKRKFKNDFERQVKTYRACGVAFIVMMLIFSGLITLIYTTNMYFEYAGLMIYVFAVFTVYKLTFSVINMIKARKQDDLYIQSIRNINLATAIISIVVLQVAMFQAFAPEYNTSFANGLTGAAASAALLVFGVLMIVKANKLLKQKQTIEIKQEHTTEIADD